MATETFNKPSSTLPPPTWETTNRHSYGRGLRVLWEKLSGIFLYYVILKGNKVSYLRRMGVRIGEDCEIITAISNFSTEPWLIEIHNRVTVTQGVIFLTHDGANRIFRHELPESSRWGNRFGTIQIFDNTFIGVNTIIMPGVKIGPNSIVGVNSVITTDIPPETVAAGTPARPICTLAEYKERYKQKMIPIAAKNRDELRQELTQHFWGEKR